jgi:hypothetical protein
MFIAANVSLLLEVPHRLDRVPLVGGLLPLDAEQGRDPGEVQAPFLAPAEFGDPDADLLGAGPLPLDDPELVELRDGSEAFRHHDGRVPAFIAEAKASHLRSGADL